MQGNTNSQPTRPQQRRFLLATLGRAALSAIVEKGSVGAGRECRRGEAESFEVLPYLSNLKPHDAGLQTREAPGRVTQAQADTALMDIRHQIK